MTQSPPPPANMKGISVTAISEPTGRGEAAGGAVSPAGIPITPAMVEAACNGMWNDWGPPSDSRAESIELKTMEGWLAAALAASALPQVVEALEAIERERDLGPLGVTMRAALAALKGNTDAG